MVDQPIAALLKDLKQHDLLDTTLVVWGSEFGRTALGKNRKGSTNITGRDHHPYAFSLWMAGGGIKGGLVHGETDDFAWHVARDPVFIHDFHATILHLFGLDFRLTGVNQAKVVKGLIALLRLAIEAFSRSHSDSNQCGERSLASVETQEHVCFEQ